MAPAKPPDPVNRRDFARTIAAATAATAATALETSAADAPPKTPQKPDDETKADPDPPPPAVLALEIIRQQYPDKRLDDQDVLQGVYNDIRGDMARSRRLSGFPLKNADEPGFLFAALDSDH